MKVNLDELFEFPEGVSPILEDGDTYGGENGKNMKILKCKIPDAEEMGFITLDYGRTWNNFDGRSFSCDRVREYWKEMWKWQTKFEKLYTHN